MTTTNQPTARIRINRTRTSTGKHGYDATVEIDNVDLPEIQNVDDLTDAHCALMALRALALEESDILIAELEQRVNGAEVPAADAG